MIADSVLAKSMSRLTVALALLAIVSGLIGFYRIDANGSDAVNATSTIGRFFDVAYLSLGMLSVGVKNTYGEPFLSVGRWFGVLFVFAAVLRFLIPQAASAWVRQRVSRLDGHSVVVGLGAKGAALMLDLARLAPVVGVDQASRDRKSLGIAGKLSPVYLIKADAQQRDQLSHLGLRRARRVIVCTGSDTLNHAIAAKVLNMVRDDRARPQALDLIVHFHDHELSKTLLGGLTGSSNVQLRTLSLPVLAARYVLSRHRWLLGADRLPGLRPRWVYLGWDEYAESLLHCALELGNGTAQGAPVITVFVEHPEKIHARLRQLYPAASALLQHVELKTRGSLGLPDDDAIRATEMPVRTSAVFLFDGNDSDAFTAAQRARAAGDRLGCWQAPLFLRLDEPDSFSAGLQPLDSVKRLATTIEAFGGLRQTCANTALRDWQEHLAQRLHQTYRAGIATSDSSIRHSAADADWYQVSEEFRDANRRVVDHLPVKLAALGYVICGELPLPRRPLQLGTGQLDLTLRMEHASWCAEKYFDGWTYAPVRDDRRRHHDGLVAFDALSRSMRQNIDPINQLLEIAAQPSDSWLGEWIRVHRAKGGGAYRERVLAIRAVADLQSTEQACLASAIDSFLLTSNFTERLGEHDDEFWTMVTELRHRGDVVFARALAKAVSARTESSTAWRRYRFCIVRSYISETREDPVLRVAIAQLLAEVPCFEWWFELPEATTADTFLLARCDDWLFATTAAASIEHENCNSLSRSLAALGHDQARLRAVAPLSPDRMVTLMVAAR